MRFGRFWLDAGLWLRVWVALQRLAAATVLMFAHAGYGRCESWLYRHDLFSGFTKLLSIIEGVFVLVLTAAVLFEAVRIFLPPPFGIKIDVE